MPRKLKPCILGRSRQSRAIWTRMYGDPGEWWVLHRCHNRTCREPSHFYLGTLEDNERDARRNSEENGAPYKGVEYWRKRHEEVHQAQIQRWGRIVCQQHKESA